MKILSKQKKTQAEQMNAPVAQKPAPAPHLMVVGPTTRGMSRRVLVPVPQSLSESIAAQVRWGNN